MTIRLILVLLIVMVIPCISLKEALSMQSGHERVQFDVLIKSSASSKTPSLENIEEFRPDSNHIEICLRWFRSQGITIYATDFGLAGETSRATFEKLFKVRLIPAESESMGKRWTIEGMLQIPPSIADYIDQITLTVPPELY